MKLYIDSSNNLKTIVKISEQEFISHYQSPRDQDVLGAIKHALLETNGNVEQISEIEVITKGDSFTGLRVGVSIAQALSFCLQVPINGQKLNTPIKLEYSQAPSITPSSKF